MSILRKKKFLQKKYIIVDSKKIRVSTKKNNIIVSKIKNDNAHKKKSFYKKGYTIFITKEKAVFHKIL
jgi:hypothetical protein